MRQLRGFKAELTVCGKKSTHRLNAESAAHALQLVLEAMDGVDGVDVRDITVRVHPECRCPPCRCGTGHLACKCPSPYYPRPECGGWEE